MSDADAWARLRWTSVPYWPRPELPPAASYLACCFGGAGERRARALLSGADPRTPVHVEAFADHWSTAGDANVDTDSRLRGLFGECLAGVRIILAGPESVVMRAAAVARQCGATSEELVLIATEAAQEPGAVAAVPAKYVAGPTSRRVFCANCRQAFDAVAALADLVTCPGCAAQLIVDHRFSRPHAAYFGWPASLDLHR
jgi:hypothetical protein